MGVGIGLVFGSLIEATARNPSLRPKINWGRLNSFMYWENFYIIKYKDIPAENFKI